MVSGREREEDRGDFGAAKCGDVKEIHNVFGDWCCADCEGCGKKQFGTITLECPARELGLHSIVLEDYSTKGS